MKLQTKLSLAYYACYAAYLVVIGIFGFLLKDRWQIDSLSSVGSALQYAVIFYMIVSIPGALYGFKKKMHSVSRIVDPVCQEQAYFRWALLRMVLIALGGLLAVVAFYVLYMRNENGLLMHNQSMMWCAAISIIAQFFCKPTEDKIYQEMNDVASDDEPRK